MIFRSQSLLIAGWFAFMRGIAGVVQFHGMHEPSPLLGRMLAAMALTSPADARMAHDRGGHLGYVSRGTATEGSPELQPWRARRNSALLVTAAFLHNREELAAAFGWSAEEADRRPDGAFVLAAFEKWGEACPPHLAGTFSLAIWQPQEQRLFCAVNRSSTHPIYYWHSGAQFAFASTLGGLFAHPEISRQLNAQAFADQFSNVPADLPETLYRDIRRLCNGHALAVDASGLTTWPCWTSTPVPILRLASDADYVEALREQLAAAVRRSLRGTSGQVGLLLSGGLDSSAIAAVAGRLLADEGRRLQAIHVVPRAGNRYQDPYFELDESRYVRSLQAHAPHIDFHFPTAHSVPSERAAWDDYFADNFAPFESLMATDPALDQLYRQLDLSLLIDGVGGNDVVSLEAFPSGYLAHLAVSGRWFTWWREARGHGRVYGRSMRMLTRHTFINPIKARLRPWELPVPLPRAINFLHPSFRQNTGVVERFRAAQRQWNRPAVDFRQHLHDFVNVWSLLRTTTPPSVFAREAVSWRGARPLYDRPLTDFCLSLPFDQQVRDGWDRRLLREAMRGLLPEDVRLRVRRGFPQPEFQQNFTRAEPMLREELEQMGSSSLVREFLDYDRILALWRRREAEPTLRHEILLTKCIVAGAFLRWHERHAA